MRMEQGGDSGGPWLTPRRPVATAPPPASPRGSWHLLFHCAPRKSGSSTDSLPSRPHLLEPHPQESPDALESPLEPQLRGGPDLGTRNHSRTEGDLRDLERGPREGLPALQGTE